MATVAEPKAETFADLWERLGNVPLERIGMVPAGDRHAGRRAAVRQPGGEEVFAKIRERLKLSDEQEDPR